MAQQTVNIGGSPNDGNGDTIRAGGDKINDNFTELYSFHPSAVVYVRTAADLPAPVANVITLSTDNVTYLVYGLIDLTGDRIDITATGITLRGVVANAGFISTTTGNVFTGIASTNYEKIAIIAFSASWLIHQVDGGASGLFCHRVGFVGGATTRSLHCENYINCVLTLCAFVAGLDGIEIAGTVDNLAVDLCRFEVGVTGTHIDYNGATVQATTINNCAVKLAASSTFIEMSVDGGNITSDGGGTITSNKINNSLGGTVTVGYSPLDLAWTVLGNNAITTSDRLQPTGWGHYSDGDTVTLILAARRK